MAAADQTTNAETKSYYDKDTIVDAVTHALGMGRVDNVRQSIVNLITPRLEKANLPGVDVDTLSALATQCWVQAGSKNFVSNQKVSALFISKAKAFEAVRDAMVAGSYEGSKIMYTGKGKRVAPVRKLRFQDDSDAGYNHEEAAERIRRLRGYVEPAERLPLSLLGSEVAALREELPEIDEDNFVQPEEEVQSDVEKPMFYSVTPPSAEAAPKPRKEPKKPVEKPIITESAEELEQQVRSKWTEIVTLLNPESKESRFGVGWLVNEYVDTILNLDAPACAVKMAKLQKSLESMQFSELEKARALIRELTQKHNFYQQVRDREGWQDIDDGSSISHEVDARDQGNESFVPARNDRNRSGHSVRVLTLSDAEIEKATAVLDTLYGLIHKQRYPNTTWTTPERRHEVLKTWKRHQFSVAFSTLRRQLLDDKDYHSNDADTAQRCDTAIAQLDILVKLIADHQTMYRVTQETAAAEELIKDVSITPEQRMRMDALWAQITKLVNPNGEIGKYDLDYLHPQCLAVVIKNKDSFARCAAALRKHAKEDPDFKGYERLIGLLHRLGDMAEGKFWLSRLDSVHETRKQNRVRNPEITVTPEQFERMQKLVDSISDRVPVDDEARGKLKLAWLATKDAEALLCITFTSTCAYFKNARKHIRDSNLPEAESIRRDLDALELLAHSCRNSEDPDFKKRKYTLERGTNTRRSRGSRTVSARVEEPREDDPTASITPDKADEDDDMNIRRSRPAGRAEQPDAEREDEIEEAEEKAPARRGRPSGRPSARAKAAPAPTHRFEDWQSRSTGGAEESDRRGNGYLRGDVNPYRVKPRAATHVADIEQARALQTEAAQNLVSRMDSLFSQLDTRLEGKMPVNLAGMLEIDAVGDLAKMSPLAFKQRVQDVREELDEKGLELLETLERLQKASFRAYQESGRGIRVIKAGVIMSENKYSKDDIIEELVKRIVAKEHHKTTSITQKREHPLAHPLSNILLQINAKGNIGLTELESLRQRCINSFGMKLGDEQHKRFGIMLSATEELIKDMRGPTPPELTPVSLAPRIEPAVSKQVSYRRGEDMNEIYARIRAMRGGDDTKIVSQPAPKPAPEEQPSHVVSDMVRETAVVEPVKAEEAKTKPARSSRKTKPRPQPEPFAGNQNTAAVWAEYEQVWGKINAAAKKAKIHDGCEGLFDHKEPRMALALTMPSTMKRHTEEAKAAIEDNAAHALLDRLAELHSQYYALRKASLNAGDALAGSRAGLPRK